MPSVRFVLSAFALLLSVAAQAEVYPAKPIRLVVPYPAGGGTDFFVRTVGAQLSTQLGLPMVVENGPGAATTGFEAWAWQVLAVPENTPQDASAYIRSEALKWAKVISEGRITVE